MHWYFTEHSKMVGILISMRSLDKWKDFYSFFVLLLMFSINAANLGGLHMLCSIGISRGKINLLFSMWQPYYANAYLYSKLPLWEYLKCIIALISTSIFYLSTLHGRPSGVVREVPRRQKGIPLSNSQKVFGVCLISLFLKDDNFLF